MNVIDIMDVAKTQDLVVAKGAGVKRNRSGRITRTKILDAAEQAFADKGINGASLREIMMAAAVNIAAVNYYFGNKDDLLKAVVRRRAVQINGARMVLLDEAYRENGGVPSIDGWMDAFIRPFIDAEGNKDPGWRNFTRVLNWMATAQGQDPLCQEIIDETYGAMRQHFLNALGAALPDLPPEDVAWRYQCSVAVLRASVMARDRAAAIPGGVIDPKDIQRALDHIVAFLRGGLTAPATYAGKS
jgi:AcrR family transcriptional regulator